MPRRYNNRRRRVVRKKKPAGWFGKRYQLYSKAGSQLFKDVMYLKGLINVERKYNDITGASTIGNTWQAILLNGIAQGDTTVTRDGSSQKAIGNLLRLYLKMNASATASRIRVVLVRFKPSHEQSSPVVANMFEASTDIQSPLNKNYARDYKIYLDHTYALTVAKQESININKYMPLKFHTRYSGTGATFASVAENQLWVMFMSDEATNTPTYDLYNRFNFIDN